MFNVDEFQQFRIVEILDRISEVDLRSFLDF